MRCRRIVNGDVVWFGAIPEAIPPQKSLEKTTWDELEAICHRGLHTSYFKVGDKKTVNVNGQDYKFVIADFDRYDIIGKEKKACITFMMENVYQDDLQMNMKSQIEEENLVQAYNMRTTGDGLPVVDEAPTTVHKIQGATVASKNMLQLADGTTTLNGVTAVINSTTGEVTLSGESTLAEGDVEITVATCVLPTGTYTFYMEDHDWTWYVKNSSTGDTIATWMTNTDEYSGVVFTLEEETTVSVVVAVNVMSTLGITIMPAIAAGDVTADFPAPEPFYAGIRQAYFKGIVSTGRNLITSLVTQSFTSNGVTVTPDAANGTVTINGTPVNNACSGRISQNFYLPKGTYTVYAPHRTMRFVGWHIRDLNGKNVGKIDWAALGGKLSQTFIVTEAKYCYLYLYIPSGYGASFSNYVETPMLLPGAVTSDFPAFELYKADTTFALNEAVQLGKWDYIDVDRQKIVTGTAILTQETPFTDEQLTQYSDYVLSADRKTIAYKTSTETETPIFVPRSYKAYRGGCEYITANANQEQNLDNLEITVDQTYSVLSFGWQPSDIRETTLPMLFKTLDQHLQHAIETVGIESYAGDELVKTYDKLFIPATFEIENLRGTDKQFIYYRSIKPGSEAVNRIRYLNNVAQAWWTRDSSQIETQIAYLANGNRSSIGTSQTAKIPICFCVGERQSVYTQFFNENDKHDNYADKQQGVADSLTQRLSVIKSELWYNVYYGLPLLDKLQTKFPLDAFVTKTVQEHPDVVSIKSFTSKVVDHRYTCAMIIQSKYGEIQLNI